LAGARTEPPVSLPSAKSQSRCDTAAAEPDDEPPLMRLRRRTVDRRSEVGVLPVHRERQLVGDRLADEARPASSRRCTVGAVVGLMPDSASRNGWPPLVG
jgi:hypothetical protein